MASDAGGESDPLDLRALTDLLRGGWVFIVLLAVLASATTYAYSASSTDLYRATAQIRVTDPNSGAVFNGVQVRLDAQRDVNTQIQLLRSSAVRGPALDGLGADRDLVTSISESGIAETDLISITVVSPSPKVAAKAANLIAGTFVVQRKKQVGASYSARADELRTKVETIDERKAVIDQRLADKALPPEAAASLREERASLDNQQGELRSRATELDIEAATRSGSAELAERAVPPTTPFTPTPLRDAALAGVLAALLGIALAFLRERLDDRVRTPKDAENAVGDLPVIGEIPILDGDRRKRRISRRSRRQIAPEQSSYAESMRALATNLRFSGLSEKRTRIMVTSSGSSEGKSTVVANLAAVLADAGMRVVVVSLDLRRPTVGGIFGIQDETKCPGISDVLLGDKDLPEALQTMKLDSGARLVVLPSGRLPQNPSYMVGSPSVGELFDRLESADVDFVLVDTPPVLPVADALMLSQLADGVLVLARVGKVHRRQLSETVARLAKVNAPVVGIVLNGVPAKGRYSRYYGAYGYGTRSYTSTAKVAAE
jgi:capsular exopolysaccharide synthesis family protein